MRFSNIVAVTAVGITGALAQDASTNAVVVEGNPIGASYVATLPEEPAFTTGSLDGNVKGSVSAKTGPGGVGVTYDVKFSNIPKEGGPFVYHIHVAPVPADGNCTSTLAHLDPFLRGETPSCDSTKPETCQVGDLSGKYGKVESDSFEKSFHDPYTSTMEGMGSFFGNRSFVFHFANKTRISCANFVAVAGNGTTLPTGTGSPTAYPTATPSVPIGASNVLNAAKNFALVPFMAVLLAL